TPEICCSTSVAHRPATTATLSYQCSGTSLARMSASEMADGPPPARPDDPSCGVERCAGSIDRAHEQGCVLRRCVQRQAAPERLSGGDATAVRDAPDTRTREAAAQSRRGGLRMSDAPAPG